MLRGGITLILISLGMARPLVAQHESRAAVITGGAGRAINERMIALTDSGSNT